MDGSARGGRKSRKRTFQSTLVRQNPRDEPVGPTRTSHELPIASRRIIAHNAAEQNQEWHPTDERNDDDDDISVENSSNSLAETDTKKRVKRTDPKDHKAQRSSHKRPSSGHAAQVSSSLAEDWCQQFSPAHCKDLGIHPKKVEGVRSWVRKALYETGEPNLLILRGPTGSGKSTLVKTVVHDLEAQIIQLRHDSVAFALTQHDGAPLTQSTDIFGDVSYSDRLEVDQILGTGKPPKTQHHEEHFESRLRVLVCEDADQLLSQGEFYAERLRTAIHRYLSTPSQTGRCDGDHISRTIAPPIILVITESNSLTTEFRPSLILGETITKHPRTTIVELNVTAPTILRKALERIVEKVRNYFTQANYMVLKSLCLEFASSGNIRNAVNSLQFRAWTLRNGASKTIQTAQCVDLLQVRASPSLFHSAGKVLYNKRGEEPQNLGKKGLVLSGAKVNTTIAIQDRPLPPVEEVARIAESDAILFVSTLYENYLLSCGSQDHATDIACVMSLADVFLQARENGAGYRQASSRVFSNAEHSSSLLALGLDFAIRGTMHSLPWPVIRTVLPEGPRSHHMRYPEIERIQRSLSRKKFEFMNREKPEATWISFPMPDQELHAASHQGQMFNASTFRLDDMNRVRDESNHEFYKLTMPDHPLLEDERNGRRSESVRTKLLEDDIEEVA